MNGDSGGGGGRGGSGGSSGFIPHNIHTHTHICTLYMYERGKHYGGVRKSNSLAREVPGLRD